MSNEVVKQHGVFSWNELITVDVDAAKAFYGELLDWTFQEMNGGAMACTIAKAGEREVAGMMVKPPVAGDMPMTWWAYVTVDNVDARTARVESLGARSVYLRRKSQGAMLGLVTYAENFKGK